MITLRNILKEVRIAISSVWVEQNIKEPQGGTRDFK